MSASGPKGITQPENSSETATRSDRDRGIDRIAQPFDDYIDRGIVDDERWREQHVVAALSVRGAAHWIDHEPARHRLVLDARIELARRVEWLLGSAVGDQLEALQQAAAAHVADERMIAEALAQAAVEMRSLSAHIGEKIVTPDHALHR